MPVPRRQDLHSILLIGSGPIVIGQACEFDYSGTQAAKVLRSNGLPGGAGQLQPGDDHDRSRVRRCHLSRADHPRGGGADHRAGAARCAPPHARGADRPQLHDGPGQVGRARPVRRGGARRQHRRHRRRRGQGAVQAGDGGGRAGDSPGGLRPFHGRGGACRSPDRLPGDDPAVVHPRRWRDGHRRRRGPVPRDGESRVGHLAGQRDPGRGVGGGLEGVRARGDEGPGGQRGHRLLDREPRPDGGAHRGLDHGRTHPDTLRPRVPGDARRGDHLSARHRRGDGRVERPVRRRPGDGHGGW